MDSPRYQSAAGAWPAKRSSIPATAASYAEARRELALKIGLGRPTKSTKEAPAKTRRTRAKAA
jgi:predicted transcriptional regulator